MKQTAKKHIIERLVEVPTTSKRPFWAREMSLLKKLLAQWEDLNFWHKVNFGEKFPTLAYLLTPFGKERVKRKYNEFTFEIPLPKTYDLGEKIAEDRVIPRRKTTIRSFLNNEQSQ